MAKLSKTPPIDLNPDATEIWQRLAPMLIEREQVTPANAIIFAADCETLALYRKVLVIVQKLEKMHYAGPNGAKCQEPDIKTLRELRPLVDKIRRQWGLTPYDLAMLSEQEKRGDTKQVDKEDAEFDAL